MTPSIRSSASRWAIAAVLAALSLGLPPTTERALTASLAADPHTLVVARDLSDTKTLDPDRLFELSDESVDSNIYDSLVTIRGKDTTKLQPVLASRWTVSHNNRVFTFFLRHDVRFS